MFVDIGDIAFFLVETLPREFAFLVDARSLRCQGHKTRGGRAGNKCASVGETKKIDALFINLAYHPVNGILTRVTVSVYQCVCISVKVFCSHSLLFARNSHLRRSSCRVEADKSSWNLTHSNRFLLVISCKVRLDEVQVLFVSSPCCMSVILRIAFMLVIA